uniref:Uncharacterized protein n=1 Tax=Magallana gigas TaxID=29159 RepID=A0A8W8LDH0_MAGGI
MIGMIPHNMPPIVNPTPDAPSALSSHVPTNMNQDSVWIIGSSIIHWAQKYAETTNQLNLGLNHFTINWNGVIVVKIAAWYWRMVHVTVSVIHLA